MARSTIGLDIGTTAVRAAELKHGDPPTLVRFAQLSLPPGAVLNGEVSEPEAVTQVIKDLWHRGEFKGKRVAIAVANQNVIVRPVELPRMEEEDLRTALPFQVADYIPIPLEEALLDFLILDEFMSPDGDAMMRVLAVAAQREMVDRFVDGVVGAGLEPIAVDVGPLAALRPLIDPAPSLLEERTAEAVVDIGGGITNVVVHEQGTPRLVRIVLTGGNDLTQALATELNLELEDAEREKISIGLQPENAPVPPGAATIIESRARAFIDDVRRSLEYYRTQADAVPIARATIVGGGSRLPRLGERLAGALRIPVEEGHALRFLNVADLGLTPEQLDQVGVVASIAIGLAMES